MAYQFQTQTSEKVSYLCLVLLRVPKYFGPVQIFCAIPNTDLHIVTVPKVLCQTIRWFSYSKFSFCAGTKRFGGALKFNLIFGLAKHIWTGSKHFASCKRTRHYVEAYTITKHREMWNFFCQLGLKLVPHNCTLLY